MSQSWTEPLRDTTIRFYLVKDQPNSMALAPLGISFTYSTNSLAFLNV